MTIEVTILISIISVSIAILSFAFTQRRATKHDDAEDCLAGLYDKVGKGALFSFT